MKKTPPGWPRISSSIFYDDAPKAIEWLAKAFGFEVRIKVDGEGGKIIHSELVFGEGVVSVSSTGREGDGRGECKSPAGLGGANTQRVFAYVDDIEAHFARAKAAGAKIVKEPTTNDYGAEYWSDRTYQCVDPEGHHWSFSQRLTTSPAQGG